MILVLCSTPLSADWPDYRGNCQRTGYREQELRSQHWKPYWQFEGLSPPQPAWPAPAPGSLWQNLDHIEARVTEDQADVPLIVQDIKGNSHVLITSSANDCLVAIDPLTGEMEWQYVTRAPVRYAPSVEDGVAYLGADDGIVRAIDIATGMEKWQSRIGPEMPWIVGNDRLVSSHPIRSSVLIQNGCVYATAGLFPSQGVYAVSLDAKTGDVVWRRKIRQSPQGYLLADQHKIFVPTGRTQPFAIKKTNGSFMFDMPSPGGSFCMLTPEAFFAGPGNDSTIQAKPQAAGAKMLSFKGKQVVAGAGSIWTANGAKLVGHSIEAVVKKTESPIWSVDCKLDQSLIASGQRENLTLFVAGGSTIKLFHALTGKQKGQMSLNNSAERIKYLAVSRLPDKSQELLVATTVSGNVYAWQGTSERAPETWPKRKEQAQIKPLATQSDSRRVDAVKRHLKSPRGLALVLEDKHGGLVDALLSKTELRVVSLIAEPKHVEKLRLEFQRRGSYGHRVTIWQLDETSSLPFSKGIFNVVLEKDSTFLATSDLLDLAAPESGFIWRNNIDTPQPKPKLAGSGVWRHQYASPANGADSQDDIVGNASAFRLLWFGGVGPSRMPDRHLRGPAPLSAGGSAVMQGDGMLIGIDPANGTERWQLDLPEYAMRYVTPFDAGYVCLTENGSRLFVGANKELWQVDAYTGKVLSRTLAKPTGSSWGYVAEQGDCIYASLMKPSAPRTAKDKKTRYTYVNSDYRSERPLVTSRRFDKLKLDGTKIWSYSPRGVILNGTIALGKNQIVFVESRSQACVDHQTDRIPMSALMENAHLVSLDPTNGKVVWQRPLEWADARNMLYAQLADGKVILTSSRSVDGKANYVIRVLDADNGSLAWEGKHRHIRQGLFHGEQVHHPVVLNCPDGKVVLVAEPYLYDLATGERMVPADASVDWALRRPGHSCGTLSGAGHCLFFRAGNPTVLNLSTNSFTPLSPTRAGCWINMIPAGGRLLIPEGSASCVCNYSLQTSMAFAPVGTEVANAAIPVLPDVLPELELAVKPLYGWNFETVSRQQHAVKPSVGNVGLQSLEPLEFSAQGLKLNGTQWLANSIEHASLPTMPETISLEAWVQVDESPQWSGLIGAVQDNGNYERGCMLGIHNGRFFFSLASEDKRSLTYLESPTLFRKGQMIHVVGTYDGRLMRLYIDGEQVAESDQQKGPLLIDTNSWLSVGAYKDSNELYPFTGIMKSAFVYQGVLSAESIKR